MLDIVTTGMYKNSLVSYREYIQNSCDSIDQAIKMGLGEKSDFAVQIKIDSHKRTIKIYDNGRGIPRKEFFETLIGNVANSNKIKGEDKGFRGIGRLCGLAYCEKLIFSSTAKGENIKSMMTFDASRMREELSKPDKATFGDVLSKIVSVNEEKENEDLHYFEVDLIGVNASSVLLNSEEVVDYLSFVAPVKYKSSFKFGNEIEEYALNHGFTIDTYRILVNNIDVFKEYNYKIFNPSKEVIDKIFKVEFKEFTDSNNNVIAWMWYGLSRFEGALAPKANPMRGLRIRQGNIQIGDSTTVRPFFREEGKGNSYFIGEIFTVDKNLVPNAQRDYFNENGAREMFENSITEFFHRELYSLYYAASKTRSLHKEVLAFHKKKYEYEKKQQLGFVNETEQQKWETDLHLAEQREKESAEKIKKLYDDIRTDTSSIAEVQREIQEKASRDLKKFREKIKPKQTEPKPIPTKKTTQKVKKENYFTAKLSRLNRSERTLVQNIITMLQEITTPDVVIKLQSAIEKEYK